MGRRTKKGRETLKRTGEVSPQFPGAKDASVKLWRFRGGWTHNRENTSSVRSPAAARLSRFDLGPPLPQPHARAFFHSTAGCELECYCWLLLLYACAPSRTARACSPIGVG